MLNNLENNNIKTATVFKSDLNDGVINISGYKHAATVIIAASLIQNKKIQLENVPHIHDVTYLAKIIETLGGTIKFTNNTLAIDNSTLSHYKIPVEYSQYIHGALYLLPVLLGKLKNVEISHCGGCSIGDQTALGQRPILHMISILEKFGAKLYFENEKLIGFAEQYKCCTIDIMDYSEEADILTGPLVSGATKTAILAAGFVTEGVTVILNPYPKPDVTELLNFMELMGYNIKWNNNAIEISYGTTINPLINYYLMSDISQIMTYITLSCFHNINLKLNNITVDKVKIGLYEEINCLRQMGIIIDWQKQSIIISPPKKLKSINIKVTSVGIYSDHQPFFALMLTQADGPSSIQECVWKNRFSYAQELIKLGMKFKLEGDTLRITPGQTQQIDHVLFAHDLRAAAVLLIAALKQPNKTIVKGIEHLPRGYDHFINDLVTVGAKIDVLLKQANEEYIC